jgi:hypothetical protein
MVHSYTQTVRNHYVRTQGRLGFLKLMSCPLTRCLFHDLWEKATKRAKSTQTRCGRVATVIWNCRSRYRCRDALVVPQSASSVIPVNTTRVCGRVGDVETCFLHESFSWLVPKNSPNTFTHRSTPYDIRSLTTTAIWWSSPVQCSHAVHVLWAQA